MARIMGIDYGKRRTGIAVTDNLQIIVSPLTTVDTDELLTFLQSYMQEEEVEKIIVGEPLHADGSPSDNHLEVLTFVQKLKKEFPDLPIELHDEYLTSKMAKDIIIKAVPKKMKRRDKTLVDKVSATLILQDYLKHI